MIFRKHLFFFIMFFSFLYSTKEQQTIDQNIDKEVTEKKSLPNSWEKIGNLYLSSLDESTKERKDDQVKLVSGKKKKSQLNKKQRSDYLKKILIKDKKNYIKNILTCLANGDLKAEIDSLSSKTVFDDTTCRDLNIFKGKDKAIQESFFNIIDFTQTIAGRLALLDIIYNPLVDTEQLLDRQICIKKLIEDKQLYKLVQEKLMTIEKAEKALLVLFTKTDFSLISSVIKKFYLKSVFDLPIISSIIHLPFINMISHLDKIPTIKKFNKKICKNLNKKTMILEFSRLENYFNKLIITPAILLSSSFYFVNRSYNEILRSDYMNALGNGVIFISTLIASWFLIKNTYSWSIDDLKCENLLHETVGILANMVETINQLQKIILEHPELMKILSLTGFKNGLDKINTELKNLFLLLEDDNFKSQATWKTSKGKMISVFKFLKKLKYELIKPYLEIGELDAFMSAATLYKKHCYHSNTKYHFVNYEKQATPHLCLKNFWNPFINPNIVVTNSIELGTKAKHRNILLTGPNAGGKSTALKAIAFSVLLAQTLTIANANMVFTPFSKVFTTLNITDTVGKESLYQADKNRIKNIMSILYKLNPNEEKVLLISDEMFNSTGASYGAALFYGTLNYVDKTFKNTLFIAATHFENLVELEKDTKNSVANFRVEEAKIGKNGKLTWTYKIKPGINMQNISFELAQEDGFNSGILDASKKFLKKHSNKF